jgi:ribosomal protein S12 methylthiotransferase accessory factor
MSSHDSSFQRLCDAVEVLVDDHVGIIRYVVETKTEPGAPDFFHFFARACDTRGFCEQQNFGETGGASFDRRIAMAKAIGEAIERYCAALYERDDFPLATYRKTQFRSVPPNEFALYSPAQYQLPGFPFVPFDEDTPIRWTPAIDLESNETWYVPAAMVFVPYYCDYPKGEKPIGQSISTGLACHMNPKQAAISAICEVIERDAFTITWQAKLAPPQIRLETLSDRNRDLVMRFERTRSTVVMLNITMDHGVPTILSVLRSQAVDAPALVFAASADPDPEQAGRKSLEELAHSRRLAQRLTSSQPHFTPTSSFDNIKNLEDHIHMYCDHANASLADFIFASPQRLAFKEIENLRSGDLSRDLATLVTRIRSVKQRVLITDLTSQDVGGLGFSVVRAIIPGFHPLVMGHAIRALGGSRLWEVPQTLGHKGIRRESGDNPASHPYP